MIKETKFAPFYLVLILVISCQQRQSAPAENLVEAPVKSSLLSGVSLVVLGTVQDAGSPQIGCKEKCCQALFAKADPTRKVVSLGLIDSQTQSTYLFEATPDIAGQIKILSEISTMENKEFPDGVFLTHAHIGHYSGLMYFGMEAANTTNLNVFTMPRMRHYLENNGPWSQLLTKNNIRLESFDSIQPIRPNINLEVIPLLVPHRDEFSEAVGYLIKGPNKKALFIPDIDKWSHWETNINDLISEVDYAFLDATFYDAEEIKTRDLTKVLHPFVVDSMERFKNLSDTDRNKIYFIHFNHTNPLLDPDSEASKAVLARGFRVARFRDTFDL